MTVNHVHMPKNTLLGHNKASGVWAMFDVRVKCEPTEEGRVTGDVSRISFLGARQMGMPMVRRLVGAGRDTVVCPAPPAARANGCRAALRFARPLVDAAGHFHYKDVNLVDEVARELDLDLGLLGYVNREGPLDFRPRAQDT